ncbi:glycoside hydrolase family 105 protein [Sphingomonas sp. AP4-R1]|uniref:glycoside hydrolase family 88/105 protein n=1 Tax=Sphingomonas sp. AP4-R1 TaxID=2735134 RepID=UPI001C102EB8|nr:glycoside hydrolase family 88 protein [Sphingomonas sp. AP4-R1]
MRMKESKVLRRTIGLTLALATMALPVAAQAEPTCVATLGADPAWRDVPARPDLRFDPAKLPDRAQVMSALDYVAAAQIADMACRPLPLATGGALDSASSNWVAAAFYVGAERLARENRDPRVLRFLSAVAEHYNYAFRGARLTKTLLNADDLAIGDLYAELYARRRQPGTLVPLRQRADVQVPYLTRKEPGEGLIWWWSDALFMAPPVLARLSALTGDPRYLQAMDAEWRRTAAVLWDEKQSLIARDARFKQGAKGRRETLFWSRGNGWTLAGLARVIEAMPADYAGRAFYVDLFRKLAIRVAGLQQADGLWSNSLLDRAAFPEPETSGSGFFVYGLAWGVNHGLLDRAKMLPVITRGWAGLNDHVLPSGLVGAAQKTGDQPAHVAPGDVGPYATGAYLLAGVEVARLGAPVRALPEPEPARDDAATIAATTPMPPPPATVVGDAELARRAEEMRAVEALSYDPDREAVTPARNR